MSLDKGSYAEADPEKQIRGEGVLDIKGSRPTVSFFDLQHPQLQFISEKIRRGYGLPLLVGSRGSSSTHCTHVGSAPDPTSKVHVYILTECIVDKLKHKLHDVVISKFCSNKLKLTLSSQIKKGKGKDRRQKTYLSHGSR